MPFKVVIDGFKTKKQALAFLNWYEGMGEQDFDQYLDCANMPSEDGCNINCNRKGTKKGTPFDELEDGYLAEVS